MVNAPDAIFVKRHRGRSGYHDEVFHDDEHVIRILTKILDDASGSHRKLDPSEGLQDAQLDNGARLHIVHGDISRGGHVMVNIRKFTGVAFRHLDQLVERDMLSPGAAAFLAECVRARQTIVFAGAPGSGKTTLLSCCAAELDPALRVVVAEEVFEADVPLPNVASMQTRPGATRPARGRPAPARRRVPPHGARRRDRRRGPRPRGAAAAAHAVVGREGVHHDPRRLGSPGAHPPALHLPAVRGGQRAAAVGAQHAREREHRRRRALRPRAARAAGHRDRRGRGSGVRAPTPRSSPSQRSSPARATARSPGPATCRCGSATRSTTADGRSISSWATPPRRSRGRRRRRDGAAPRAARRGGRVPPLHLAGPRACETSSCPRPTSIGAAGGATGWSRPAWPTCRCGSSPP